jgi:hypothetical protein
MVRRPGALLTAVVLLGPGYLAVLPGAMAAEDRDSKPAQGVTPPPAAAPDSADSSDLETLRQRAAKFWAARIAGDFTTQFELIEPRGRGRMTPSDYAGQRGAIKYLAYEVEEARPSSANKHFARVKVRLLVQPVVPSAPNRRIPPQVTVIGDRWVLVGGAWYRSFEQGEEAGNWPSQ